jgi:hypothetical protein
VVAKGGAGSGSAGDKLGTSPPSAIDAIMPASMLGREGGATGAGGGSGED